MPKFRIREFQGQFTIHPVSTMARNRVTDHVLGPMSSQVAQRVIRELAEAYNASFEGDIPND